VIAHWLACKARAKYTYTKKEGINACMHGFWSHQISERIYMYIVSFFFPEKMSICVVLAPES
jgi:hypothetical protein